MKGQFLIIIYILFFSTVSLCQENFGIKGIVLDDSKVAIESGNIILLNPIDSTVIKGAPFWDGKFEVLGIQQNTVLLKITAFGFEDYLELKKFKNTDTGLVDIGIILLEPNIQTIKGVDVVYTKPMFERKLSKLIMNIEGTILSEKGTILELLRSAPNVVVSSSGNISVVNKGSAIIYIDGQRINSNEILNTMSANDIDRIEIIETPSAKYDAEGQAVIEIITKSGAKNGVEGSLGIRGMYRTESQMSYWANLSLRKNWFSLYAYIGQYTGILHENENYYRDIDDVVSTSMDNTIEREVNHNFDTWGHLKMDFRLDSSNTIFTNYYVTREHSKIFSRNSNLIYENDNYTGDLYSESNGDMKQYTHYLSGGYTLDLKPTKSSLIITGQYTNYNGKNNSEIDQVANFTSTTESRFKNESENLIGVYSVKADFTKKINKKINLSVGIKYSSVNNHSSNDFQNNIGNSWVTDSALMNKFEYNEGIIAGYSELTGEIDKFSYLVGLRFEHTKMKGNSIITETMDIDRSYDNFFPNVFMNYKLTEDLQVGASYNYRVSRPLFQDLNPFVTFIDSITSLQGNPQLLPAYSHNLELNLIYMEYASIKLGYTKSSNPVFLTVEKDETSNRFKGINQNLTSSEMYTIGLVIPWENKWWTTFNSFGYNFNKYIYEKNDNFVVNNQPTFYVNLYNEFRLKKIVNIEVTYEYISPGAQGIFIGKPYHNLMLSLSRSFLNKKLKLNFSIFDPFKFNIERASANLNNFRINYSSWMDSRNFMLTLRWSFGKMKDSRMTEVDLSKDGERIKK